MDPFGGGGGGGGPPVFGRPSGTTPAFGQPPSHQQQQQQQQSNNPFQQAPPRAGGFGGGGAGGGGGGFGGFGQAQQGLAQQEASSQVQFGGGGGGGFGAGISTGGGGGVGFGSTGSSHRKTKSAGGGFGGGQLSAGATPFNPAGFGGAGGGGGGFGTPAPRKSQGGGTGVVFGGGVGGGFGASSSTTSSPFGGGAPSSGFGGAAKNGGASSSFGQSATPSGFGGGGGGGGFGRAGGGGGGLLARNSALNQQGQQQQQHSGFGTPAPSSGGVHFGRTPGTTGGGGRAGRGPTFGSQQQTPASQSIFDAVRGRGQQLQQQQSPFQQQQDQGQAGAGVTFGSGGGGGGGALTRRQSLYQPDQQGQQQQQAVAPSSLRGGRGGAARGGRGGGTRGTVIISGNRGRGAGAAGAQGPDQQRVTYAHKTWTRPGLETGAPPPQQQQQQPDEHASASADGRQDEAPPAATRGRSTAISSSGGASRDRTPFPGPAGPTPQKAMSSVNEVANRTLRYHIRAAESHNKSLRVKAAIKMATRGSGESSGGEESGGEAAATNAVTPPPCWGPLFSQQQIQLPGGGGGGGGGKAPRRLPARSLEEEGEGEGEGMDESQFEAESQQRPAPASAPVVPTPAPKKRVALSTPASPPPATPQQQQQQAPPSYSRPPAPLSTPFPATPAPAPAPASAASSILRPTAGKASGGAGGGVVITNERIAGAASVVGTCHAMCPDDEIAIRSEMGKNKLEDRPGLPPSATMIKDLERNPPADYPVSKIRPVEWLLRSVEYMEDDLMDKGRDGQEAGTGQPLDPDRRWGQVTALENYKFHFQRLRMVAKELIMQNFSYGGNISTTSIEIVERLTRYWIVFQHHLNDNGDFVRDDGKQNTEQLTNTLVPLKENYAYAHMLGQHGLCAHEPEFHAYSVLLTGDIKQATKGYAGVSHSPEVRLALDVLTCVETGNYARFFRILRRAPYIFACLMAKYVDRMRTAAVETMARTFNPAKGRVTQLPLPEVLHALCLLDEAELIEFAEGRTHLLLVEPGSPTVGLRRAGRDEGVQQQLPAFSATGDSEADEEKRRMHARKARAAMILKQSFPYVPFIEAKAHGVRFRDLTRGIKGVIRLSTPQSLERAAAAATAASSALKAPPPLLRPTVPSPAPAAAAAATAAPPAARLQTVQPPAKAEDAPATKKRAALTPVPAAPVLGTPEKKPGGPAAFPLPGAAGAAGTTMLPIAFGAAAPAPAAAASIPTVPPTFGKPPPLPSEQKQQQQEEQRPRPQTGQEEDEGRTRKRRVTPSTAPAPALAPAPAPLPVAQPQQPPQQQQPPPLAFTPVAFPPVAFPPVAWPPAVPEKEKKKVEPPVPAPAPAPASAAAGGGGGLFGTLGKWMERAASGVRAIGERRANQKKLDETAQRLRQAAQQHRLRAAFRTLHVAAARSAWRRKGLQILAERVARVFVRAQRRAAFQHWTALVAREHELEAAERARFEASLQQQPQPPEKEGAGAGEAPMAGVAPPESALALAVAKEGAEQAAAVRKRRRHRRSSVALAAGGRLPGTAVKPLDLPQLVGPTLWSRHEQRFAALLNPGRDPAAPSLLGWKLVVEATEQDPAGAWLLGALTLESADKRQGQGQGGAGDGAPPSSLLWLAEYRLEAGNKAAGRGGRGKKAAAAAATESAVDVALCVKRAAAQHEQQQPEAAHALLVHLPEPSYAKALAGGEQQDYWAAQCRRLRACVAGVTPGAPLLLCLGPEALAALDAGGGTLDVRQQVAQRLGLAQRGFADAADDEEAVGFDWEVLPLPEGLGRATGPRQQADKEARQGLAGALAFLAEAAPTVPLVVRETLVSLVGEAVQAALWEGAAGEADVWAVTAEACRQAANTAVAAVRARLCAQEVAVAPWPIPELALDGPVVPHALWWDAAAAMGPGAGGQKQHLQGGQGPGLPVGWNAIPRLLRLEALLRAVELPELPFLQEGDAAGRDPVAWVERYLAALKTDAAASGWSPGLSPSLAQFARDLALAAREQWGLAPRGRRQQQQQTEAPWNRLFSAFVVDRVALALNASDGGHAHGGSKDPLALRWTYRLHTVPTPDARVEERRRAARGGATLREYEEMDLDEGHRKMVGVVRTGRRVSFSCLLDPNAIPAARPNRRRRRRRRPSYALDLPAMEGLRLDGGEEGEEAHYYLDDEASVGGGQPSAPVGAGGGRGAPHHKRARRQLRTPQPVVDEEAAEAQRVEAVAEAYIAASTGAGQRQQEQAWAAGVGSLTSELVKEAEAWGDTKDFLRAYM